MHTFWKLCPVALTAVVLTFGIPSAAQADVSADFTLCMNTSTTAYADKVTACSHVVSSNRYKDDDLGNAYFYLGSAQSRLQQYASAIGNYGTAIALRPTNWAAYYNRAFANLRLGQNSLVVGDVSTYISHHDEDADGYRIRGDAEYNLKQYAAAAADFAQAIAHAAPPTALMYIDLGDSYAKLGDHTPAQSAYTKAVNADSANQDAKTKLATETALVNEKLESDAKVKAAQDAANAVAAQKFQTKLKTLGAGDLFVLADTLKEQGDTDKQHQALRALVSRFPTSKLAVNAAQQMAGVSGEAGTSRGAAKATGGSGSADSGRDCDSILREYGATMDQYRPGLEWAGFAHTLWVDGQFLRMANALPVCRADAQYMQRLQKSLDEDRAYCVKNNTENLDCQNGVYMSGHPNAPGDQQAIEAAYQRMLNQYQSTKPSPQKPTSSGGGVCKQELDKDSALIDASTQRLDASKGQKAIYMHTMWAFSITMQTLDKFCKGQPDYNQYSGLKKSFDAAKQSCVQISSDDGSSCVPTKMF